MTAKAHNAVQTGHYEFREKAGTVTMIGPMPEHADVLKTLFEACGWTMRHRAKRRRKK